MITNAKEQKICDKYSAVGIDGKVHCFKCPLRKGDVVIWDFRCKANSHYDRRMKEWIWDKEYTDG